MYRFFDDDGMNFATLIALGSTYRGVADVGEVLATIEAIPNGDRDAWVKEWSSLARRCQDAAESSAAGGHTASARAAWLRASLYYDHASAMAHGTTDPAAYSRYWDRQRECWDQAVALFDPPVQKVGIAFEGGSLEGYFFSSGHAEEPRPCVILNNGSDGPVASMWCQGGAAAVERGWNAFTFDGPGQGAMFHRDGVPFRSNWETVISPVVDWLIQRPDVDGDRIVLHGVSQAGYWVPRAAAFEPRLAAIVADPGVVDVSTSWTTHLPPMLSDLLESDQPNEENKAAFDEFMAVGLEDDPGNRAMLEWRMAPYGTESFYEAYRGAMEMRLDDDTIGRISCPTLVTDPDDEQFWPGQSRQLSDKLTCRKELVRFTRAEGADGHCEVAAQGLRDERIFDWLETILN